MFVTLGVYILRAGSVRVILTIHQAVALLTTLTCTSHVLLYAPSDSFICRSVAT